MQLRVLIAHWGTYTIRVRMRHKGACAIKGSHDTRGANTNQGFH